MERLVHNDFYNYITRGVKIRIAERIRSCVGQPLSSWSADTLQMYAPYIIYLSEKQLLAEMPMSTVCIIVKQVGLTQLVASFIVYCTPYTKN